MDFKIRRIFTFIILVALGILIVIRLTMNKPHEDVAPFAAKTPKVKVGESGDGHSTGLANDKMGESIDAQRKAGMARGALLNVSFPFESVTLGKKLREDVSFAVGFPEPERDIMLATIGERFAAQFSASGGDVSLLFERLVLYEDVLREFNYSVESSGFSLRSVIECVTDPARTKLSGLKEDSVIQAYDDSKSKLLCRIAGRVIAQRLVTMGLRGLTEIDTIEDKGLRINTEREAIRLLALLGGDNTSGAISYYLSQKCEFENERAYVVEVIGSAFNKFPESASQVVFDAPKGLKRDSAIVQMVVRMNRNDPESAQAWIDEISDPSLKKYAQNDFLSSGPLSLRHLPPPSGEPDPFADPKSQ